MTTKEFCVEFGHPVPKPRKHNNESLMQFLEIDAFKLRLIADRAKFIVTTPVLGDFIATNLKGEPIKKPEFTDSKNSDLHVAKTKEYQKAESRVRFVGWELTESPTGNEIWLGDWYIQFYEDGTIRIWNSRTKMIEDYIKTYGAILTAGIPLEPNEQTVKDLKLN